MSAEHGHAAGVPIFDEFAEEMADVWGSLYSVFSMFLFALFGWLDIIPKSEAVSHGGH